MRKLWETDWRPDAAIEAYTVGLDPALDLRLLPYEIYGTLAHAAGLVRCGVLTRKEFCAVRETLNKLLDRPSAFRIRPSQEDIHTALEQYLTRRLGKTGKKIHTGRSRNDQVQVDLRLYLKDRLLGLHGLACRAAGSIAAFGRKHQGVLLPGYTHLQRAMPTTLGHWAASHAEALLEGLETLRHVFGCADRSPLGSAAGFGAMLTPDRDYTAKLLGFGRVHRNTLRVQTSRPRLEAEVVSALALVARDLGVLATDAWLFATAEFGFFRLSAAFTTGSSIMPQKRNPDVLELTRARAALLPGWLHQILALSRLPSGYHRDYQLTKEPLFRALDTAWEMLEISAVLPQGLSVNPDRCQQALGADLLATQQALEQVERGVAFREAYRRIARSARDGSPSDPAAEIRLPVQPGTPGNPDWKAITKERNAQENWRRNTHRRLHAAWKRLLTLSP